MRKTFLIPASLLALVLSALVLRRPAQSAPSQSEGIAAVPPSVLPTVNPITLRSEPRLMPSQAPRLQVAQAVNPATMPLTTNWAEFQPKTIALNTPSGPLNFTTRHVSEQYGRTVLRGDTNEFPGAHFSSAGTANTWSAFVTLPDGNTYVHSVNNGQYSIREINPDESDCCPIALEPPVRPETAASLPAAADIYYVDLLFVYTADYLALPSVGGSLEQLLTQFVAGLGTMNNYLTASGITNMQWRMAGHMQMPAYPTTLDMTNDLNQVTGNAAVHSKREEVGADQVIYVLGAGRQYAGLAWMPITPSRSDTYAVSVAIDPLTIAHELGHNFGCRHDRTTENAPTDTGYNFGHRFTHNGQDTGTIVSYAPYRLSYFSNPSVFYEGQALGIAAGQPGAADNARVIREKAALMSNIYAVPSVPVITTNPASVSLQIGQNLNLSVSATGTSLHYQWKKGAANVGADAATLSIANVALTDAGGYSVVVSNTLGSVTSTTATVTVTEATVTPPVTPPSTGGGGGSSGGGGGAISDGLLLALAALVGARLRQRSVGKD